MSDWYKKDPKIEIINFLDFNDGRANIDDIELNVDLDYSDVIIHLNDLKKGQQLEWNKNEAWLIQPKSGRESYF